MPRYRVMIDDNFHYQELDMRREHGNYDSLDEAISVCRKIVDQSLREEYKSGMSADDLYSQYTSFGNDPFIVVIDGATDGANFSAWNFAKERCRLICDKK
jgi:hypothetical protein